MAQSDTRNPQHSFTEMNELVLPNDTNTLNNLMGGKLLHWMDICAAIAAQKHSNRIVVTASVDSVSFKETIRLGDVVTLSVHSTQVWKCLLKFMLRIFLRVKK